MNILLRGDLGFILFSIVNWNSSYNLFSQVPKTLLGLLSSLVEDVANETEQQDVVKKGDKYTPERVCGTPLSCEPDLVLQLNSHSDLSGPVFQYCVSSG